MRGFRITGRGGAVALLWASAALAQDAPPTPRQVSAVQAAELYADACAPCHGSGGDGRGPAANRLGRPGPRDFTLGVFKFRSTPTGSLPSNEDLYRTISRGVPGTWMPAWEGRLSSAERWALVEYVKGFSTLFLEQAPDPAVTTPPSPPPSPVLVQEGRHVYAMLGCTQCHGVGGRGDGPSARELRDDWGAPIQAYDFTRGPYRNGSSGADLYRTLVTGLSGTPMPALESETVGFAGGPDVDLTRFRRELPPSETGAVERWLAGQPSAKDLDAMPPDERRALIERRLWGLVSYVLSLSRPRSFLHGLLVDDPEPEGEVPRP